MDRAAGDAVNTLLETSGTPTNWEINGNPQIVGLAQFNTNTNSSMQGTIDPVKLNAITQSEIQQLIGNDYNYNMTVSTISTPTTTIKSIGNSPYNVTNVVRVQRTVLTSQFKIVSELIGGQILYTGGVRNYNAPTFQTTLFSNQTYTYWIYFGNVTNFKSVTVSINNNAININNLSNGNNNNATPISSSFLNFNGTNPVNNTISLNATGSFPSSMDFYIVQSPKNVTANSINSNTVVPQYYNFIFYLWSKG